MLLAKMLIKHPLLLGLCALGRNDHISGLIILYDQSRNVIVPSQTQYGRTAASLDFH